MHGTAASGSHFTITTREDVMASDTPFSSDRTGDFGDARRDGERAINKSGEAASKLASDAKASAAEFASNAAELV